MSLTGGFGEHWGGFLSGGLYNRVKQIIKKIGKLIRGEKYYIDADFKIKVEKLSIVKGEDKAIDISQLVFHKEIVSLDELKEFL